MTAAGDLRCDFETIGFAGPLPLFDQSDCRRVLKLLQDTPPPMDWFKGKAVSSRAYYRIGTHPVILDCVAALLGDDVLLWGANLVRRRPGQAHSWHTDIETSGAAGRTVTVWIGLANTNQHSSLHLVPYSQRL